MSITQINTANVSALQAAPVPHSLRTPSASKSSFKHSPISLLSDHTFAFQFFPPSATAPKIPSLSVHRLQRSGYSGLSRVAAAWRERALELCKKTDLDPTIKKRMETSEGLLKELSAKLENPPQHGIQKVDHVLICMAGRALQGIAAYMYHEKKWISLSYLLINPDNIDGGLRGVGTLLVNELEDEARSNGVHQITLFADPSAVGFYERLNYKLQESNGWDPRMDKRLTPMPQLRSRL